MTLCLEQIQLYLQGQPKSIDVSFDAPDLSSDAGFLLLAQIDQKFGLSDRISKLIPDQRDPTKVKHTRKEQVQQRIFQIAQGYEDCNDADRLRHDPVLKSVCGQSPQHDAGLSSQPTLCRFENSVDAWDLYDLILDFEQFYVDSLDGSEQAIILDIDTSDDPTHGQQQLSFFHGYYGGYIYHPTLIFDQYGRLISAILRPGNTHASKRAGPILERIIRRVRAKCPNAAILVRGDSGFSVPKVHERIEKLDSELGDVRFLLGQATNGTLKKLAAPFMLDSKLEYERTGIKVRECFEFPYAAASWKEERRIILKAEHSSQGANPRFLVTSLEGEEGLVWYDGYCQRGQAENHIKELMNAMFGGRLSCSSFVTNAFRLLLYGWAYRLMWGLREEVKKESEEAGRWQFDTLRVRLLKVAVIVKESVRRIWTRMPLCFPLVELFRRLLVRGQRSSVGT